MADLKRKQLRQFLSGSFNITGSLNVTGSIEFDKNISGSITSTGSFHRLESDTISVTHSPFASGSEVQAIMDATSSFATGSTTYVLESETGSFASGSDVQTLLDTYVKQSESSSFASGSDVQVLKDQVLGFATGSDFHQFFAESSSYIVESETGSFASGSDVQTILDTYASGSDVQGILDTYASGSDLHQFFIESSSYVVESETGSFASGSDVQGILDTYASGSDVQTILDTYASGSDLHQILAESSSYLVNADTGSLGATTITSTLFVQGGITTSGSIVAKEFRTEFVTESIIFASGSTQFGDSADDTHNFTGSISLTGNISGSSTSTGSFGYLIGDAGGITNLPPAAITSYTNTGDNKIVTSVDSVSVQGEDNLTFNGSVLNVTGDMTITGDVSGSSTSTGSFGHLIGGSSANINGFTFPTTDGTDGQAIVTDGSGVLTFDDIKSVAIVKNISGVTLQKGTPVHATGSVGNTPTVIAASASNASTMPATFVLDEELVNDAEGRAILSGFINGVNTAGFVEGGIVYVGENGGYTQTKPTGTNLIQNLGIVTKVDANGSGYIYGSGRSNDVPNLLDNTIFYGSGSNQMQQIHISGALQDTTLGYAIFNDRVEASSFTGSLLSTNGVLSSSAQIASDISGSFTAGTGLDLSSGQFSVDVSDFMSNGVDNRVLTATGTDAFNAEANLTFDGNVLVVPHISASGNISGSITSTGSFGRVDVQDNTFILGNLGVGTNAVGQKLQVDGDVGITGKIDVSGSVSGGLSSTGSFGYVEQLGVKLVDSNQTASFASGSDLHAILAESSSYMVSDQTGSMGLTTFSSNVFVLGDLSTSGSITAREFKTEFVSSSILYASGSNKFGDTGDDIHEFSGSIKIGNLTFSTSSIGIQSDTDLISLSDNTFTLNGSMVINDGANIGIDSDTDLLDLNDQNLIVNGKLDSTDRIDAQNGLQVSGSTLAVGNDLTLDYTSPVSHSLVYINHSNKTLDLVPPASASGQIVIFDGTDWVISDEIDGGNF